MLKTVPQRQTESCTFVKDRDSWVMLLLRSSTKLEKRSMLNRLIGTPYGFFYTGMPPILLANSVANSVLIRP